LTSDQGGETAAICFSILAGAKRYRVEPLAYVRALLVALSSDEVDLESLPPDVWLKAHPEHFLKYRRDEAEAAAQARRRVVEPSAAPTSPSTAGVPDGDQGEGGPGSVRAEPTKRAGAHRTDSV
jgi:hypothetical protein